MSFNKNISVKILLVSVASLIYLLLNIGIGLALPAKTGETEYFKVEIKSIPKEPVVNKNTKYIIKILDVSTNKPVNSALLVLKTSINQNSGGHDAMSGMEGGDEISGSSSVFSLTDKDGIYEANIDFDMEGDWQVLIKGDADGKSVNIELNEDVIESASETSSKGKKPKWIVIGNFLSVMVGGFALLVNKNRIKASEIAGKKRLSLSDITIEEED